MHRIFTEGGFAGVLRAGDSRRYKIDLKNHRESIIQEAVSVAAGKDSGFKNVFKTRIKNRACVSITNYSHSLILRAIAKYLIRRFKIYPRNRDSIVKEIIETLSDSTPMYVIRRDLSSFYESLPTTATRTMLEFNTYIPSKIKNYIRIYFSQLCPPDRGVPRGVGLSAVVAELAMKDTDHRIREIPGVYKYFRYSDDILIFSYITPENITKTLEEIINSSGLKFNRTKSNEVAIDRDNRSKKASAYLEYLGYKFSMLNSHGDDKPRTVNVSIADRKILRIKSRVICSLKCYERDRDAHLLFDRMRFISSNYFAYRTGTQSVKTSKFVKSGIFYNYHLCGKYQGSKRLPHSCQELKSMDAFYHFLLKGASSSFRSLFIANTSSIQLHRLEKISFYKGFEKKITVRFRPERVNQIKAAWRNA